MTCHDAVLMLTSIGSRLAGLSQAALGTALLGALALSACSDDANTADTSGTPTTTSSATVATTASAMTAASTGTGGMGTTGTDTTGVGTTSATVGTESSSSSQSSSGGTTGSSTTGSSTTTGTSTTGDGGTGGGAPANLSETGLFTVRAADGSLTLAEGVREFQPKYALWSDGALKQRYVYLPPGAQIDTTDADHWKFPVGTKLWKSFSVGEQLVETRLIERTGETETDWRFATYLWETAESTDAIKMDYKEQWLNAAGTTHDIPAGSMCERCHNGLKERALGFSALQLNHDLGGLNLATLESEGLLTDDIPLDIGMPGDDELTQDALGYLHANCGNCHNDSPGVPVESVPEPRMLLRVLVGDKTLADTGTYQTAVNVPNTASAELPVDYRLHGAEPGGDPDFLSAILYRMDQRGIEDQMPPIGTTERDQEGIDLIYSWALTLPAPAEP